MQQSRLNTISMSSKGIVYLVIDSGPIIKNTPSVSSLLNQAEKIITIDEVALTELRDASTRARFETTLKPFIELRNPKPESVNVVTDFARQSGDLSVLSRVDLRLLALAYELECEQNGGDWRLRKNPGQKGLNGKPPTKAENDGADQNPRLLVETKKETAKSDDKPAPEVETSTRDNTKTPRAPWATSLPPSGPIIQPSIESIVSTMEQTQTNSITEAMSKSSLAEESLPIIAEPKMEENQAPELIMDDEASSSDDTDNEGWITPSNLKKHQAKDNNASVIDTKDSQTQLKVATMTTDFAMQNVLLQMNLNLLSSSFQRVRQLKTYILRCHACFLQVKDTSKQFCPRCGGATLTRVACSTNQNGEFKLHLKKNMQWNTRGDRFSIPKPVAGASNMKASGGGKGGWGQGLILAEDQKEYVRAMTQQKREKQRDLMDEDYMPAILSGDRPRQGGRPKVGAGRNVNSKKR